ncbi:hypothetical protein [Arthrobacter sp. D2-10]
MTTEVTGSPDGLPPGFPANIPLIGTVDHDAMDIEAARPIERQWTVKMISPLTEGSLDEIAAQSTTEARGALLSAGFTETGQNQFTNEQYEVSFAIFGQAIFYSVYDLNAESGPTSIPLEAPPYAEFDISQYTPEQQLAFLELVHLDYDYNQAKGEEGTSDADLLQYGAEGCHLAGLPQPERITYLRELYFSLPEHLWLRRWAIVYALQELCPQHDSKAVLDDVNEVIKRH